MYLRMLRRDIKDKPGLNAVTFVFMIAAVMFMVIGSTLLYSLFGGEQKTYDRCNSSDVYFLLDKSISDADGNREKFERDLDEIPIIGDHVYDEAVFQSFTCIEMPGKETDEVHYSSGLLILSVPDGYDRPIDFDNQYFDVENGCVAVSQILANRFGLQTGDKVRLTTQYGNTYEYVISVIFMNPASAQMDRMYISDRDKEIFYSECPVKSEMFTCTIAPGDYDYISALRDSATDLMLDFEDYHTEGYGTRVLFMSNDGLFALIVSICMLIVAVAVMAMTMITIDFSLKSAIKREEREIGMMKAIGVWSLSYKTLFIVKYLFFALVGGLVGLPLGFFLSKLLFNKFVMNVMYPDASMMILIGVLASLATVLLIILFSFTALRRMNRISVIDAIHGESRGERFTALPGLSLNTKKHMPVPLFLAISDILRGFKRYILLILAYILGISVVLFVVRLNDSIMNIDYAHRYFQRGQLDFMVKVEDSYYDRLLGGAGSFEGVMDVLNKDFEENDIPAEITVYNIGLGVLSCEDGETVCNIIWSRAPSSEIWYISGNAPVLYNEVAIGYYSAQEKGIEIGDTVTIEYDKYTEDHTTFRKVKEDFIVTGMVDRFGTNSPTLFMGDEFDGSGVDTSDIFSCVLDVPASEYDEYIDRMQSLYPDGEVTILNRDEVMPNYLTGYQEMFRLIITLVSLICAVVLILLTTLYENIFLDEETADIALLKSMGFDRKVIRSWHFLRLMLLSVFSLILTYVFLETAGNGFIGNIFANVMKSSGFKFKVLPVANYVIVPLCVIGGLAVVIGFMSKLTDKIQIWKVRNE